MRQGVVVQDLLVKRIATYLLNIISVRRDFAGVRAAEITGLLIGPALVLASPSEHERSGTLPFGVGLVESGPKGRGVHGPTDRH